MSGLKVKLDESKVRKETIPKRLNQKLQGIYLYTAFSIDDYMQLNYPGRLEKKN